MSSAYGFLLTGKFSALSVGSHIDTDNCVAVLPSGRCLLVPCKNYLVLFYHSLIPSAIHVSMPQTTLSGGLDA